MILRYQSTYKFHLFTDTRRRDRNCRSSFIRLGRRHRPILQPLGQDPNASAIPARLQARSAEGARHWRLCDGRLQWAAFASGNTTHGNKQFSPSSSCLINYFAFQLTQRENKQKNKHSASVEAYLTKI